MKAKVIKIGNSRGLRLPAAVIEQVGIEEEVLMEATRGSLVIRPARGQREGWAEAFQRMAVVGDDRLLDIAEATRSTWDQEEWEWK